MASIAMLNYQTRLLKYVQTCLDMKNTCLNEVTSHVASCRINMNQDCSFFGIHKVFMVSRVTFFVNIALGPRTRPRCRGLPGVAGVGTKGYGECIPLWSNGL